MKIPGKNLLKVVKFKNLVAKPFKYGKYGLSFFLLDQKLVYYENCLFDWVYVHFKDAVKHRIGNK